MKSLIFKRLTAYLLDYSIVAIYALCLFGVATILDLKGPMFTPVISQLVGFISLTLPVFLYFFLMERSTARATIGKKLMNISVHTETGNTGTKILFRNILKFLPWEIAHTGVYWVIFYSESEINTPAWVWIVLILPQIVVIAYFISIIVSNGESAIYDTISNTRVKVNQRTTNV